jgi:hypothetical protein
MYMGSFAGVTVNLSTGAASGGHAAGDTISGIEDVSGSGFGDTLTGTSGANYIYGGYGDDVISSSAPAPPNSVSSLFPPFISSFPPSP